MTTNQTIKEGKKRKRLTLEEQIARQEKLLKKEKDNLAKKQKRLRSLNASKMNKDRIQAQKKRNSMLIQLGLYYIEKINCIIQENGFEFVDAKEESINIDIKIVEDKISEEENIYNEKYFGCENDKEKIAEKSLIDKKILLEALNNIKANYLIDGIAKIKLI